MDYKKIHDLIIERAQTRVLTGYKERHHIVPKCMGGTNDSTNLVELTAREHFIIHKLLYEIHPEHHGLFKGYYAMAMLNSPDRNISLTAREYEYLRIEFAKRNTGVLNHYYGKKHSEEVRAKMKKNSTRKGTPPWNKGLTKDDVRVAKYANVVRWNTGLTKDDIRIQEQIKKSIETRTGKSRGNYNVQYVTCPYCNVTNTTTVIKRAHLEKCKYKI
jgi:hypothetical protein